MAARSDTRRRLVATAAQLWHAKSYGDVAVNEICEQAGVHKGTFYHYFPSKSDVAVAVLDARREQASTLVFGPVLEAEAAASPLTRLEKLTEAQYLLQVGLQSDVGVVVGCPVGNLALELSTQDERVRERCVELFDEWISLIEPLLAEAVAVGEIPPIDVTRAAMAVVAYIEGVLLLAKTRNDIDLIPELAHGVRQLAAGFAGPATTNEVTIT